MATSSEALPPTAPAVRRGSYGQILKATGLMGGSSVGAVLIALVRTKAMAVMLGPAGFGFVGALSSVADLARTISGAGIGSSGVRQIADAARDNDEARIARTAAVLLKLAAVLGAVGAMALMLTSVPLSVITFGTGEYGPAVAVLSLVVLLNVYTDGRMALLQGLRRIGDIAKIGVLGPLFGTLMALPLVYWLGSDGVAPALVALAAASLAATWWYSRRLSLETAHLDGSSVRVEVAGLLRLGVSFMLSALIAVGAVYLIRVILLHRFGLEAAGLYQAAWTLGGLYVGFILQAMSTDFLPRLTAVANDDAECNRLVNEQALIGMLLAAPGVLGTLALAEIVIPILYTVQFNEAAGMVRWFCVGMALRVAVWPMSFVLVARSEAALAIATDVFWGVAFVSLAWILVGQFGPEGAGMAFVVAYVLHALVVYPLIRHLTGFRWSSTNRKTMLLLLTTTTVVFVAFRVLPSGAAVAIGCFATAVYVWNACTTLAQLVPAERLPGWLRRCMKRLLPSTNYGNPRAPWSFRSLLIPPEVNMLRTAYRGLVPLQARKANRRALDAISDRLHADLPPRRLREHISPLWLDFVASGRDQLEFNIELAGLLPTDRVLDIACGCGRFAMPLTGYLRNAGSYEGLDVMKELIEWCSEHIGSRHPNFRFQVADVTTPWSPNSTYTVATYPFPYSPRHFDFVYAGSLFTHLTEQGARNYLRQASAVLKPGGRFVCTWLLFNSNSAALLQGKSLIEIWPNDHGTHRTMSDEFPELSVTYDELWVRSCYEEAGLKIVEPIRPDATYSAARIPEDRMQGRHLYYAQSIIAVRVNEAAA